MLKKKLVALVLAATTIPTPSSRICGGIEYDKGKVVSVKVSISGSSDSSSNTFDVPVMYFDGQWLIP